MARIVTIGRRDKRRHASGGFRIEILEPGLARGGRDSGAGAIGRIDDARISPGTVVRMHPHKDDEILTYLRKGAVMHLDSEGLHERISPSRLMLMNAGHTFQHEEEVLHEGGELRGLQIFMRPRQADLDPLVQFHDFGAIASHGIWRLIAGPDEDAPLRVRAQAWVHDVRLAAGNTLTLPAAPAEAAIRLLYVFSGTATILGVTMGEGESAWLDDEAVSVTAVEDCDLVLFTTDPTAEVFAGGMFSGNTLDTRRGAR